VILTEGASDFFCFSDELLVILTEMEVIVFGSIPELTQVQRRQKDHLRILALLERFEGMMVQPLRASGWQHDLQAGHVIALTMPVAALSLLIAETQVSESRVGGYQLAPHHHAGALAWDEPGEVLRLAE